MIELSSEHAELLTAMTAQGASHFIVMHPCKADKPDIAADLKKRMNDSKVLAAAGLIENVTKNYKEQVSQVKKEFGRTYTVYKLTKQAELLFGTSASRSIN